MLKDALPGEAEKQAAVGDKEKQKPQEPVMSQEEQEKEDFEESDKNFDDRLNYEEYKSMQDRIFDRTLEKGMPGVLYNEQQLDKRYKFMCALAKCTDGPSLNTFKKVQMMINQFNEIDVVKMTLKAVEPESFERQWTTEEEGQVMDVVRGDVEAHEALPEEAQANISAFMIDMRENNRFKQEYTLSELLRFIEADKDKDGRLNIDEYFEYRRLTYNYFTELYGAYYDKDDEGIRAEYKMLLNISRHDDGPNFQTIVKCNNICIVGTAHMELEAEVVHLEDDNVPLFQWTEEQMDMLTQIDKEDDELIMKKLPPVLSEFIQRLYIRAFTETFDREMQTLLDKQLFIKIDEEKTGRLTFEGFK